MVPLNKSGLVQAKPGNFTLKSLNRCFSNYYQVRTWPVFAETVTYIYPGHPCKVNELEYSELLPEVCPLLNGESKIHRYALHY